MQVKGKDSSSVPVWAGQGLGMSRCTPILQVRTVACGLITKNLLRDLSMLLGSRSASAANIFLLSVPCLPWTCPLFISFHKLNASSQSTAIAFPQSTWGEGGRKEGI